MGSPEGKNGLIHFGPFELDPDAEQLRKSGVPLKLQPQQFVVLLLLAQRAGEIVSRQEIQQRVWGDGTFVDFDRGINFCINQIRAALGDDADRPRYIETLPRRGYRFIADIDRNGWHPGVAGSDRDHAHFHAVVAFGDSLQTGELGCNGRKDVPADDFSGRVPRYRTVTGRESDRFYLERSGL